MSWELLIDAAGGLVELAANWWIQSFVLLGAGLALGALCQRRGSAVQSAIYRTTLVAVIAAPAASWLLARAGWTGWSITMPEAWTTAAVEPSPSAPLSLPAAPPEAADQRAAAADLIASSPAPPPMFAEQNGDGFGPEASYQPDPIHGVPPALAPPIASPSSPAPLPSTQAPGDATPVTTVSPFGVVAAIASSLWIAVGVLRLVRIAVAWRRLGRIRRQAVPAEDEAQQVCREIAGRLAVTAPAVLRSPYLPSPCLTGLRRPAVLLPEAAGDLPVRDVLAHELAHLSRGDCHWNLARQLAAAVLFFQPLMGRLSRRLEATAEEVCDDYVVHLGGDRRNYAHRLVDIAELSQAPFAPAGVGIVSLRSMLGQRVARIMDTSRSLSTRVGGALLALVLIGGLLGTLAAGLVGLGANATQAEPTVEEPMTESAVESPDADQGVGDQAETEAKQKHIVGRVVGPDGEPVADATVLAAWVVPLSERPTERHEHRIVGQVRSDADGRFELDFSTEQPPGARLTYGWHIVAFKAGLGPAWRRDVHLLKDPSPTLQLTSDVPIRGRLLDLEGRPVAGANVRIHALQPTQTEEAIAQWIKESQEKPIPDPMEDRFYNSGDERFAGRFPTTTDDGVLASGSPALPADVRTGDDGRFEFAGVGGNRLTILDIEGPMIAKTRLPAVTRDMEPFAARALHMTPVHNGTFYGREFDFVAGPTQAIVGTVTDAETGQPLAGMEVRVGQLAGSRMGLTDFLATRTDADGKYRLVGAPVGGGHRIDAAPAVDEPYFPRHVEAPATAAGQEEIVCDMSLRRGRWIEGRVTASDDGAPVEDATVQFLPLRSNKHAADYAYFDPNITGSAPSDRFKTAADGSFRVLAIPGEGILMGIARWEDRETFCALGMDERPKHLLGERGETLTYLPWTLTGVHVVHELDVDAEAEESTCDLEFARGLKRTVKLVDAAGQPAVGVRILGRVYPPNLENPLVDSTVMITGLRPGDERDVVFIHPERRIGKALNLAAGDETTITLEPCAVARGRVVDEDGAPLAGVSVGVTIDHPDNWHRGLLQSVTDAEGRFEALLPPGTVCRVSHYSMNGPNFSAVCEATPGAVFELGDLGDEVKLTVEQTATMVVAASTVKEGIPEGLSGDDDLVTVRGQVVKPDGAPLPGADVYVLRWFWNWGDRKPLASTKAAADGRFEISYRKSQFAADAGRTNQWRETYIASFVDGFGPGWAHYNRLKPGEDALVRLAVDDVPIEGRVIDLEGNPVAGATIEIGSIVQPKADSLDDYLEAIKAGQAISTAYATIDESLPHHAIDRWPQIVTDKDGRFRASGFGRERLVDLHVSGPTIVTDSIRVATRRMEPIVHPAYAYENADETTQYGATLEYTAAPSRPIEGVVRDADTGEPLVGAEIWSWKFAGRDISGITIAKTKSEADGRFRLEGMPKGDGNRIVVVPTDLPYFTAEFDVPNPVGSDPVPLDVELHRGVWMTGRVTDKATGDPVSARIHYITFPDNPHAQGLKEFDHGRHGMSVQDRFRTDADGRYRVVALPGRGIIGLRTVLQPYPGGQGYHDIDGVEDRESFRRFNGVFSPTEKFPTAVKEINVDADAAENACDFELDPGGRLTIRAVDANGAPLPGVRVTGVSEIDGFMEPMESAEFDLAYFRPGENRTVLFYEPERRLGKALRVKQDDARDGPLEVTLEPVGVVLGRLVNDGEPASGAALRIDVAGDNDYGRRLQGTATDADGRFRHDEILPGLKYRIVAEGAGMGFATVAKELEMAAGETVDLGTIDLANEERPEPMRSSGVEATTQAAATPAQEDQQQDGETLEFAGSVVLPDGAPAGGAALYLAYYTPHPTGLLTPRHRPVGVTDAAGKFALSLDLADLGRSRDEALQAPLAAVKDGYGFGFATAGLFETTGEWVREARAKLGELPAEMRAQPERKLEQAGKPLALVEDATPLRGRIVTVDGQPAVGVRVSLSEVWTSAGNDLADWRAAAAEPRADYYSARLKTPLALNGPQAWSLVRPAVTDANGQFTLRGVGRGRIAELLVEGPGVESARVFARTEAGEPIVLPRERRSPDLGDYTYHPAEFTLVAGPSTPVVGVVRDAASGEPLAGVTVKSQARHGERITGWGQDFVRAMTDAEGRYRLEGLPIGDGNRIAAIAPDGEPYFSVSHPAATRGSQESLEIDFDMPRGVWVEARVTDKTTGRGLSGRLEYYVSRDNENADLARTFNVDERDRLQSDDNGRFRMAVLPGPGYVTFLANDHQDYSRAGSILGADGKPRPATAIIETVPSILQTMNAHLVAEINPAADAERVELSLQLEGLKVIGQVVDDQGQPLEGFHYSGRLARLDGWKPGQADAFEVIGYDGTTPRVLYFAHLERNLAGRLEITGPAAQTPVAKLQPAGRVRGRLMDEAGAPLGVMLLAPWSPVISTAEDFDRAERLRAPTLPPDPARPYRGEHESDEDGRFEIACLAPGVEYRLSAFSQEGMTPARGRMSTISGPIDAIIVVEPGQTLDLGDVKLADREEFTAAAAAEATAQAKTPAASNLPATRVLRGVVRGPDGKPILDADVAVTAMRIVPRRGGEFSPKNDVLAETKTDDEGSFEMSLVSVSSKTHQYPMLIVRAAGAALGWQKLDLEAPATDAAIELQAESPVALRLVDIEGQPAAGTRVIVAAVMQRSPLDALLGSNGAGFRGERLPAWFPPMVADAEGRIEIPHLAENFGVSLQVSGDERFAPQDLAVNTGMEEQRGERDRTYRPLAVNNVGADGATAVPLAPAQLFTGTVTYEDTGEPAPHARLTIWASQEEYGSMLSVAGEADEKGRYRISPNPGIRFGVNAYPPGGTPYLVRSVEPIAWQGGDKSREVDVKLPRGVLVRGQVLEPGTDKPVAGASVQYVPESVNNPRAKDDIVTGWQGIQVTDDDGRFEIAVLPGPGRILVHGPDRQYVLHETSSRELFRGTAGGTRNYANAIERIDPDEGAEPLELTVHIQRGETVRGELVDPAGDAVDQAIMVTRLTIRPFWLSWRGEPVDVVGGRFEVPGLAAGNEAPVHFLDPQRKLGATLLARTGMEPQRVVMQPCGKATMRFVDDDGQPVDGYEPNFQFIATPGVHEFSKMARDGGELAADADFLVNVDRLNHDGYRKTGADGNFELAALIPGAMYRVVGYRGGEWFADKDFVAEGGKTLDLGDIVIEQPD